MVNVLQCMIMRTPALCHPIDLSPMSCSPVYTDDTIILVDEGIYAISTLSDTLRSLSWAMDLTINFHKSMFIPMNIEDSGPHRWQTSWVADLLSPQFPHTSPSFIPIYIYKPRFVDCQPLIASDPLIDTLPGGSPGFSALAGEWGINFPCNALHACYATP